MEETEGAVADSIKTINTPGVDYLLSPSVSHETSLFIREEFKNGLPKSYVSHKRDNFVDSLKNPTILVKKRLLGSDYLEMFKERKKREAEGEKEKPGGYTRRMANAVLSLGNELQIAERVERVLDSEKAQQFAKGKGFDSISVVKPLAGFITKPDGGKYMIYPFVKGIPWSKFDSNIGFEDSAAVKGLIDLLEKNGIAPHDLVGRQILIDDNKMILTDMEVYHPQ